MNNSRTAFWRRRVTWFAAVALAIGFCLNILVSVLIVLLSPDRLTLNIERTATGQAVLEEEWRHTRVSEIVRQFSAPNVQIATGFGMRVYDVGYHVTPGGAQATPEVVDERGGGFFWTVHAYTAVQSGWPAKSFAGGHGGDPAGPMGARIVHTAVMLPSPPPPAQQRIIPYAPIPLGTIVNTVFYGALASIVCTGCLGYQRHRLIRRGRCPSCAYDITGLATCPECGARVTGAADRAAG